jgi:predicted kinase
MRVHYPRTPHLPWSPGATSDDVRAGDLSGLRGREVVVTEKLDGENTTLYRDGLHARSLDSAHHPSRAWVKALQGRVGPGIPDGWRVCGENVFARHSITYEDLTGFFYGFSVWDGDRCLDWDWTVRLLRRLGIPAPRVLWRGTFDEKALKALRLDLARQEGYVVRAVAEFTRADFGGRVAKWVRTDHVRTDTHWMFAEVVENRLGPDAALWAVRSGAAPDAAGLLHAAGFGARAERVTESCENAVADVCARLDVFGRTGDARLSGALAALLHDHRRAALTPHLVPIVGMPSARRVADLVGLYPALHRPFPDEERRAGLVRLSWAADLRVLHAVAAAVPPESSAPEARDQVEWSALHAEDAGLLRGDPLAGLRRGLREALSGLDDAAADRCWAETREVFARQPIGSVEEAVAATWRWRSGDFPHVVHLVGPSGSGKSTVAGRLAGPDARVISLDAIREERGSRADQRANDEVLTEGLRRLDDALAAGGTTVWDATSLDRRQRGLVRERARRRDALTTVAVVLVDEGELVRRNAVRAHPVPPQVLTAQLRRFAPPYPGEAHRTWYLGAEGVADRDGTLAAGPDDYDDDCEGPGD